MQPPQAVPSYPQHIYYAPNYPASPAPYAVLPSAPAGPDHEHFGAALLPSAGVGALPSDPSNNCCDVCCPGCSSCMPSCGNCQSCDPCCIRCCGQCPGCSPGGCCSPTGCSPTQCSGWVGAWSTSMAMQWLAFVCVLSAVCVQEWWTYGSYNWTSIGLWEACRIYPRYYSTGCTSLSYGALLDWSDLDLFQSLRAFVIMAVLFTTLSSILVSIRLARHQLKQTVSNRFEWTILAIGLTSLLTLLMAFITGYLVFRGFSIPYPGDTSHEEVGAGFALLCTALALQLVAVPMHAITLLLHRRSAAQPNAALDSLPLMEQPALAQARGEAVAQPAVSDPAGAVTYMSSFQHPTPYYPAVQYVSNPNPAPLAARYQVVLDQPVPAAKAPQW